MSAFEKVASSVTLRSEPSAAGFVQAAWRNPTPWPKIVGGSAAGGCPARNDDQFMTQPACAARVHSFNDSNVPPTSLPAGTSTGQPGTIADTSSFCAGLPS